MSFNFKTKNPPGIVIGGVWSFIFNLETSFFIFLLIELSFTQPKFPPLVAESDILYVKAEFSNPSSRIDLDIKSNFFSKLSFISKLKTNSDKRNSVCLLSFKISSFNFLRRFSHFLKIYHILFDSKEH